MKFKLELKRDSLPADIAEIALFGLLTIGTFVLQRPLYEALAAQASSDGPEKEDCWARKS
jgi:hypothetical protein